MQQMINHHLGQLVSHFAGLRNAKCETFRKANQKKVPKVMSFVIFGQTLLGNLPPRAIQTMSEKDKKIIFVICSNF